MTALLFARQPLQRLANSARPLPVEGRLLLPSERGLLVYALGERRETLVVPSGPGQVVMSAAWSPDASRLAYGLFHRRPGDPALVGEIYLANGDGSGAAVLAERDRPGNVLDTPVWSPDGRFVYFSYLGQVSGRIAQRIERVAIEGRQREVVVENAFAPAPSADGRSLLFLRDEPRSGTGLFRMALDGGQPSPVLAAGRYPALAVPRFSPDGRRIAVAIMHSTAAERRATSPLAAFFAPVAYAHGVPWDIWTFDADGGDPRRLTDLSADEPSATWSPDGRYLAIWSPAGLHVVAVDGSDTRQVLDMGSYGTLDWAR